MDTRPLLAIVVAAVVCTDVACPPVPPTVLPPLPEGISDAPVSYRTQGQPILERAQEGVIARRAA